MRARTSTGSGSRTGGLSGRTSGRPRGAGDGAQGAKLFIDSLGVRKPWRRRGLGKALLARALAQMPELGVAETKLNVDSENPSEAFRLYRALGFEELCAMPVYRKDLPAKGAAARL